MTADFLQQSSQAWRQTLKAWDSILESQKDNPMVPEFLNQSATAWRTFIEQCSENVQPKDQAPASATQAWIDFVERCSEAQKSMADPSAFWKKSSEAWAAFTKPYEDALGQQWQAALRDKDKLEKLGGTLAAASFFKERRDRAFERFWEECRLPSAADLERVYERLGELQQRVDELEETLAAPTADQD